MWRTVTCYLQIVIYLTYWSTGQLHFGGICIQTYRHTQVGHKLLDSFVEFKLNLVWIIE
jgi:hypothetical protein